MFIHICGNEVEVKLKGNELQQWARRKMSSKFEGVKKMNPDW